ncbi:hypothetical protein [Pseudoxanthomonas sp.]|uniref:hypothetical protein n=1 Tax=Pseudoxanthomonas sp. TaxID=1871049 RepID=UPI0025E0FF52|nr:hypothetical protein [Pseudoxanthomonas sp.]
MSRLDRFSSALFLAVLLSGCASTRTASTADKVLMQPRSDVDAVYVGYVNAIAKQRGTEVMWVNPPKKRVSASVASAR